MAKWLDSLKIQGLHARGGHAAVWRAHHAGLGIDVALKVLAAPRSGLQLGLSPVEREVRLLARLQHRHVVSLFDYGTVSREFANHLGDARLAGATYLAMEFAERTLFEQTPSSSWEQARSVLRQTLLALAHTHACGLIHCDLKPQNLLCTPTGIKLADFGIARWCRTEPRDADGPGRFGTLAFMAPEQLREQPVGPATDLYAVGCLAYWLLQGTPPFTQGGDQDIARGHLLDEPPRLDPRFATPTELAQWLLGLLAKEPTDRFRCAADALDALMELPACTPSSSPTEDLAVGAGAAVTSAPAIALDTVELAELPALPPARPASDAHPHSAAAQLRTEFPQDGWRTPADLRTPAADGLSAYRSASLLGLREPALVGREREREQLWRALGEVCSTRTPRVVLLSGSSGVGKSRMARWLQEQAIERGIATGLTAQHAPVSRAGDGFPGAIAQLLDCHKRSRGDSIEHVERTYSGQHTKTARARYAAAALVDLARQGSPTVAGYPTALAEGNWLGVIAQFLGTLAHSRPLVVWVDDVQWGVESLLLMEHVLDRAGDAAEPILFVATLQVEAAERRPKAGERLRALAARGEVESLLVAPLSEEKQATLLAELMSEHAGQRESILRSSHGNPLFAIQAALAFRETGEVDHQDAPLANDNISAGEMGALWESRIRTLEAECGSDAQDAFAIMLLLAAAGSAVSLQELEVASEPLSPVQVRAALRRVLKTGFVSERNQRFSYNYGLLRETLRERAQLDNRWVGLHARWAEALERLYSGGSSWVADRLAYHSYHAGLYQQALHWVPRAAEHCARLGFMDRVRELQAFRCQILDAMGHPDDTAERAHVQLDQLRFLAVVEAPQILDQWLSQARSILSKAPDDELEAHFHLARCHLRRSRDELSGALADAELALPYYRAQENASLTITLLRYCGELQRRFGNFEQALEHYADAAHWCREADDPFLLSWCEMGMAMAKKGQGKLDDADRMLATAMAGFQQAASPASIASSLNERGELCRLRGDLAGAITWYERALEAVPQDHLSASTMLWNMSVTQLQQGLVREAAGNIARVRLDLTRRKRFPRLVYPDFGSLVCAAHERSWQRWDQHLADVNRHLEQPVTHSDFAICADLAAEYCELAAEYERAAAAYALAAAQWRCLGNEDNAQRAERQLAIMKTRART